MSEGHPPLLGKLVEVTAGRVVARLEYPPPPARSDVPVATAWRTGPKDLDVADIVNRWWQQKR